MIFAKNAPRNTSFYSDKILYKNLKFFDKIFEPTFCRRRFRNAPYRDKNLVDGEMLCLGMVSTNLFRLFYAGDIQNLNCRRRLEMATYPRVFSFYTWVRFAREGKAVALQYHE